MTLEEEGDGRVEGGDVRDEEAYVVEGMGPGSATGSFAEHGGFPESGEERRSQST